MKIDKKKVVFVTIIVIVLLFIASYSMLIFMEQEAPESLDEPLVPELQEEQKTYTSKIDALNDLKEERERTIPSMYSDQLLDSLDAYAPAIEEEDREWVVDSIYRYGRIGYEQENYGEVEEEAVPKEVVSSEVEPYLQENFKEQHDAFFRSAPAATVAKDKVNFTEEKQSFKAEVNGEQKVRANDRLELLLAEDLTVEGRTFPRNSVVYGFVSLQPNRVMLKITHVHNVPVKLKAYDLQDGNEGIYVRNSFRSDAQREVLDDVIQDVNIAGLPQIGGIKNIFRRNNRNIKVTILDQYQLILKPSL